MAILLKRFFRSDVRRRKKHQKSFISAYSDFPANTLPFSLDRNEFNDAIIVIDALIGFFPRLLAAINFAPLIRIDCITKRANVK